MTDSPLLEPSPDALQALFSKNPEELSEGEILALIKDLRRQRLTWLSAEKVKQTKAKVPVDGKALDDLLKDL